MAIAFPALAGATAFAGSGPISTLERSITDAPEATHRRVQATLAEVRRAAGRVAAQPVHRLPAYEIDHAFHAAGDAPSAVILAIVRPHAECVVYYDGDFSEAATVQFINAANFIRSFPCRETLVKLHSSGGTIIDGIAVGMIIRESGWNTLAWTHAGRLDRIGCLSACAFAYLGGVRRYSAEAAAAPAGDERGAVLFHQMRRLDDLTGTCITDPQDYANVLSYEYFKYVAPGFAEPLLELILDRFSCNGSGGAIPPGALYREVNNGQYDADEVGRKFGTPVPVK